MHEPMSSGIWDDVKFGQPLLLLPSHIIHSPLATGAAQSLTSESHPFYFAPVSKPPVKKKGLHKHPVS